MRLPVELLLIWKILPNWLRIIYIHINLGPHGCPERNRQIGKITAVMRAAGMRAHLLKSPVSFGLVHVRARPLNEKLHHDGMCLGTAPQREAPTLTFPRACEETTCNCTHHRKNF